MAMAIAMILPIQVVAGSLGILNQFLNQTGAYSADFEQVVLDENFTQIDEAAGTLSILRPGKFRWDYDPPAEQVIVGDGDKVWIYDVELKQVIVRDQRQALGQSPAILLAGQGDVSGDFIIDDRGQQGALSWVAATPRSENSGFDEIRLGFEGDQISMMELADSLGQTTRITFRNGIVDPNLPGDQFRFEPPADADIIDESQ